MQRETSIKQFAKAGMSCNCNPDVPLRDAPNSSAQCSTNGVQSPMRILSYLEHLREGMGIFGGGAICADDGNGRPAHLFGVVGGGRGSVVVVVVGVGRGMRLRF